MVLPTGRLTVTVLTTIRYALSAPFRADEVGQRLAVLGNVRTKAVRTDAGVREDGGVAIVLAGFGTV